MGMGAQGDAEADGADHARASPVLNASNKFAGTQHGGFHLLDESDDDLELQTIHEADHNELPEAPPGVPSAPSAAPAAVSAEEDSHGMLYELMGGLLTTLLTLVLNVTYAGVVMGSSPELLPYLSHGISMCLASTALSNLWLLLYRRNLPFICVADSFMAVLFASTATSIARGTPGDASDTAFGTLAASILISSILLAVGYIVIGALRVCNVAQFLPSPVMAGYQASIGYLLLESASTLATGCVVRPMSWDVVECFSSQGSQALLALALGVCLHVTQRWLDGVARTMVLPVFLILATILYQLILVLSPSAAAVVATWSLELPQSQSIFTLPSDLNLGGIQWGVSLHEATLAAVTAFVPNILGKLLQYSAIEQKFDVDLDFNLEVRHAGWSQLLSAPAMMVPTVTYLGMIVAYDMGARSFLPPAMVIGGSTVLIFSGSYIVTLIPKVVFAALLVTNGLNLLNEHLTTSYTVMHMREFVLVVLHIVLTAALGMLSAVALGMLLTAVIFVVQYSSHSGVLQRSTSLLERSKVARTRGEQDILEQYGATVLIIHLHGMIFFGSASSVIDEVKAHMTTLAELQLPLRFLLLDFDRCSAIDSSAVAVLFQTRRQIRDASLIFACAGSEVLSMLDMGKEDNSFEHFTTLDLALEQCENRLLHWYIVEHGSPVNPPSPVMLKHFSPFTLQGKGLGLDGSPHLAAIDETKQTADDDLNSASNPETSDLDEGGGGGSSNRSSGLAGALSSLGTEAGGEREQRRAGKRKLRVRVQGAERLPNPFVGTERQREMIAPPVSRPPPVTGSGTASHSGDKPWAQRPGPLLQIAGHPDALISPTDGAAPLSARSTAHPDDSGGSGSDTSVGGGGNACTIYSPEQARAELRPEALRKMRARFADAMAGSYGARELEELFEFCDILIAPPNFIVVSVGGAQPPAPGGPFLYVLDRGHVTSYASSAAPGQELSQGGEVVGGSASDTNNPRHRLAKYGPGAILGVAPFVTPHNTPEQIVMPTAAITDTFCQLLRLSRSRCDELEAIRPALCFRLYRLLVLVSERRLQDHRMRVVASEAFKINVRPSSGFQRMLASGLSGGLDPTTQQPTNANPGASPATSLASSTDQLQQFPAAAAPADSPFYEASAAAGGGCGSREMESNGAGVGAAGDGGGASSSSAGPADFVGGARQPEMFVPPLGMGWTEDSNLPPSQSFPGREALPVASLASFQTAMLAEQIAEAAEVNAAPATEASRQYIPETKSTDFLWPKR